VEVATATMPKTKPNGPKLDGYGLLVGYCVIVLFCYALFNNVWGRGGVGGCLS